MKAVTVILVALFIVPACLAAEEAAVPGVELSDPLLSAESCPAESSALANATDAEVSAPAKIETTALTCTETCRCVERTTSPVTKVGSTCLKARQKAADAARALAVCPSSSTGSCGPTTHSVDPCVPLETGGFSATATATYHCEFCIEKCF